jgi:ATP-dependent 26S proteasome regulatory subunit
VLDPEVRRLLRDDFEAFLSREEWFRRHRLPYRRGYLLHGPPGNGKTSCIRIMACHPSVTAHMLNFSDDSLNNAALTGLFETAGRTAPSLIIFEDLDRLYGTGTNHDNLTKITLQHLLNCLDGLNSKDGVIVVATANDPTALDPAILRRPGRFDRVIACRPPKAELRLEYLRHLGAITTDDAYLVRISAEMHGFSYAQVRETFVLAGQLAFNAKRDEIKRERRDVRAVARAQREPCVREPGRWPRRWF